MNRFPSVYAAWRFIIMIIGTRTFINLNKIFHVVPGIKLTSYKSCPEPVQSSMHHHIILYNTVLSQLFFPVQNSEQNFECMSCFPVWNMCFTHLILLHLIILIKLGESTNYEVPWYVIFILPHYFCFHRSRYPPSTSFWIICSLCSSHRGGDFPSI